MTRSLHRRLQRLGAFAPRYTPDQCPGSPNVFVWEGEEDPRINVNAPICRLCGEVHVLRIIEEIVEAEGGRDETA
jgi:hypothetical protein